MQTQSVLTRAAVFAALISLVACADSSPVAAPNETDFENAAMTSGVLTGRATITVRVQETGQAERVLSRQVGRFVAGLTESRADARIELPEGNFDALVAVHQDVRQRQGSWAATIPAGNGRVTRAVRYSAGGGAPPSEVEFFEDGVSVSRVQTVWRKYGKTWLVARRTFEVYAEGVTHRTELTFDDVGFDANAAAPNRSLAEDPGALLATAAAAPCESEFANMYGSIDSYLLAVGKLGLCALRGGWCISEGIAVISAYRAMESAENTLDDCIAAI